MAFWTTDLTTHDGAIGAAGMGGTACFVAAGLSVLGALVLALTHLVPGVGAVSGAVAAAGEAVVFVVAGLRLRAGRGAIWGIVAALLIVLEIVYKLVTLNGLFGLVINGVLLVGIVNGVRAAFALRRGIDDPEQVAETFR